MPYKNPEQRREHDRRYYVEHKEHYREQKHCHYLENRAEILQKSAEAYRDDSEKRREDARRYYWENRAAVLRYKTKYHREHREALALKKAEWARDNRERLNGRRRQAYRNIETRSKILEQSREYYKSHREHVSARHKQQKATIQGRLVRQCNSANRRARKMGACGCFTVADVLLLLARQKNKCVLCGLPFPPYPARRRFDIDHISPLPEGPNGPENIQLLCQACNKRKGGHRRARAKV